MAEWTKELHDRLGYRAGRVETLLIESQEVESLLSKIECLQAENAKLKELIGELVKDDEWWFDLEGDGAPEDCDSHTELIARAKEMMK